MLSRPSGVKLATGIVILVLMSKKGKKFLVVGIVAFLLLIVAFFTYNRNNMINFGQEFKINRGEKIMIDKELTFEFLYHSHKMVYPEENSPLVIGYVITDIAGNRKETSVNLFLETTKSWALDKYKFELRDYVYGEYMMLVVSKTE